MERSLLNTESALVEAKASRASRDLGRFAAVTLIQSDAFPAETAEARLDQRRKEYVDSASSNIADPAERERAAKVANQAFNRYLNSFALALGLDR